jgi:glyoxylase-like metal-dependent hydrolase (beta-lactamase superfamily II)
MDGLKAVNVYVIEGDDGLTLIDGGWAIESGRTVLERSLGRLGYTVRDIRRFLVTHMHRDHYTMASVLGAEVQATVSLGYGDRASLLHVRSVGESGYDYRAALTTAGAFPLLETASSRTAFEVEGPLAVGVDGWRLPDVWLSGDFDTDAGNLHLRGLSTPGHTPGHFVFADQAGRRLFAGDHVLPTITPSVGLTLPTDPSALSSYLQSLTKVRTLPDMEVLPAHGPIGRSSHARIDELLAFHEGRLADMLSVLDSGAATGWEIAQRLSWTRYQTALRDLDDDHRVMAVLETMAHMDLLVARGDVTETVDRDVRMFARASRT